MRRVKLDGMDFDNAVFHRWVVKKDSRGDEDLFAVLELPNGRVRIVCYERVIFVWANDE